MFYRNGFRRGQPPLRNGSLRAQGKAQGFGGQRRFGHFVEKYAVAPTPEGLGDVLRLVLGGQGPRPDPVMLASRPLARRHIRLQKPVLDLREHRRRLLAVLKGAHQHFRTRALPQPASAAGPPLP